MGWCFKDEATTATDVLLDRLAEETAIVPSLWHLELANVLTLSERKGRITAARISEFIALLDTLSINVDEGTPFRALGSIAKYSEDGTPYSLRRGVPGACHAIGGTPCHEG